MVVIDSNRGRERRFVKEKTTIKEKEMEREEMN